MIQHLQFRPFRKYHFSYNPNLRLTTKARARKIVGQEGILGVTPHALGTIVKCEGMNPHTPKGASTLGIGVSMDSQAFREKF